MTEIEKIEQLFNIKISVEGHRQYSYSGELMTLETAQNVVKANSESLEWQDADHPDCQLNDGILYLLLKMLVPEDERVGITSDDTYYTFFCLDTKSNDFSIV